MRVLTLTILSFLFIAAVSAKDQPKSYLAQSMTVGHMATGQRIIGQQYSFPNGIFDLHYDTLDNVVLVLRTGNKGSLMSMNMQTGVVNWDKDIRRFHIRFSKDLMLYNTDESTKVMNVHTGEFVGGTAYDIKYIDYNTNRGLTYGGVFLDLQNNKVLWKEKMNLAYGFAQVEKPSDSTLLIASSGVHMINLNSGHGWHYAMSTTREDNTNAIIAGIAGGVLFGAVGAGIAGAAATDYISGLSSNMIVDSAANRIYYSALKSTVALTLDGKEVWKSELTKRETSKSYLWDEGDRLIHVNTGFAYTNGKPSPQGVPFIAAYSKNTGDTIFNRLLGTLGYVSSFKTIGDKTLFKIGHDLLLYQHASGTKLKEKKLDKKADKKNPLEVFSKEPVFFHSADGNFYSLLEKDSGEFLAHDTAMVYSVDNNFHISGQMKMADLWTETASYKSLKFLANKDRVAIVKAGKALAYLSQPGKLTIQGGQLFIVNEDMLTIVSLSEFL